MLQHVGQAVARIRRIEWHVRLPGLEHAQHASQQRRVSREQQADPGVRTANERLERRGDSAGPVPEFAVRPLVSPGLDGDALGIRCDLLRETLRDRRLEVVSFEPDKPLRISGHHRPGVARNPLFVSQKRQTRHLAIGVVAIASSSTTKRASIAAIVAPSKMSAL